MPSAQGLGIGLNVSNGVSNRNNHLVFIGNGLSMLFGIVAVSVFASITAKQIDGARSADREWEDSSSLYLVVSATIGNALVLFIEFVDFPESKVGPF